MSAISPIVNGRRRTVVVAPSIIAWHAPGVLTPDSAAAASEALDGAAELAYGIPNPMQANGPRVDRVVCAIDCGLALNPDTVVAQMEGGIVYALSAALRGAITLEGGRVKQSNFHDYPVLRMSEMPQVEVHIVESAEGPYGVGEPAVPPLAPAVANAMAMASGTPVRRLPLTQM